MYHDELGFVAANYARNGLAFDLLTSVPSSIIEFITLREVEESCEDGVMMMMM